MQTKSLAGVSKVQPEGKKTRLSHTFCGEFTSKEMIVKRYQNRICFKRASKFIVHIAL